MNADKKIRARPRPIDLVAAESRAMLNQLEYCEWRFYPMHVLDEMDVIASVTPLA